MKLRVTLLGALLLSGCQTLQTTEQSDRPDESMPEIMVVQHHGVQARSAHDRSESSEQRQTDIWAHMASQMTLEVPDDPEIQRFRDWYLRHPKTLTDVAERAAPFLYLVVDEIEQNQMPMELALLPIVESAYNPNARSHGNAVGLWQFLAPTGRRFGLKRDAWYDGRRDVAASTEAAMAYFTYLNEFFDGDWYNTLAAYNAGEGRIQQAIRKQQKAGKPTDFWSLQLPRETRAYVPRLLALADIIKKADHYGVTLPPVPNRPKVKRIDTGGQVDLNQVADMAGISLSQLKALNPGYSRNVSSPNGPFHLLVPVSKAEPLELALAELSPRQKANWGSYVVKRGDTLGEIALNHGVTVAQLKRSNQLDNARALRVGQSLVIPNDQAKQLQRELDRLTAGNNRRVHTVKEGESLWSISRTYQISEAELRRWNQLTNKASIKPGQQLAVRKPAKQDTASQATMIRYKIRQGDSLTSIAEQFNVSVTDLVRWNQLSDTRRIKTGDTLRIRSLTGA